MIILVIEINHNASNQNEFKLIMVTYVKSSFLCYKILYRFIILLVMNESLEPPLLCLLSLNASCTLMPKKYCHEMPNVTLIVY